MSEPFITGVIVDRTQEKVPRRRGETNLRYGLTFEYSDRPPVTTTTTDVQWMIHVLETLGVSDAGATLILQRGGFVARVQQK